MLLIACFSHTGHRFSPARAHTWSNFSRRSASLMGLMAVEDKTLPRPNVITRFLRLIRFSHTVFALPFAFGALFVAANGWPSRRIFLLVLTSMVLARTAAML